MPAARFVVSHTQRVVNLAASYAEGFMYPANVFAYICDTYHTRVFRANQYSTQWFVLCFRMPARFRQR